MTEPVEYHLRKIEGKIVIELWKEKGRKQSRKAEEDRISGEGRRRGKERASREDRTRFLREWVQQG